MALGVLWLICIPSGILLLGSYSLPGKRNAYFPWLEIPVFQLCIPWRSPPNPAWTLNQPNVPLKVPHHTLVLSFACKFVAKTLHYMEEGQELVRVNGIIGARWGGAQKWGFYFTPSPRPNSMSHYSPFSSVFRMPENVWLWLLCSYSQFMGAHQVTEKCLHKKSLFSW